LVYAWFLGLFEVTGDWTRHRTGISAVTRIQQWRNCFDSLNISLAKGT